MILSAGKMNGYKAETLGKEIQDMRKTAYAKALTFLCVAVLVFIGSTAFGAHSTEKQTERAEPANNWLTVYDCYMVQGMVCFDWSGYQPAYGTALVCRESQASNGIFRHTSRGSSIKENFSRNQIHRIAIWYGDPALIDTIRNKTVPEYAWFYFRIGQGGNIIRSDRKAFLRVPSGSVCTMTPTPTVRPNLRPAKTAAPKPRRKPRPTATPKPTRAPERPWKLQFTGINTNEYDQHSREELKVGDNVYFHAHLTGGAPSEKLQLYYEIRLNGELLEGSAFNDRFGDGSDIWVRATPFRHGTLSVRICYYTDHGAGRERELGETSVHINARDDNTQTETARGWISGADVYFNAYGSLCFDLTHYSAPDNAIIWFTRNENSANMAQSTVTAGQVIWDSPVPGVVYEYAIWSGNREYARDVAALSREQIPASAWIRLYVTDDRQIIIVSTDAAINIRENE